MFWNPYHRYLAGTGGRCNGDIYDEGSLTFYDVMALAALFCNILDTQGMIDLCT